MASLGLVAYGSSDESDHSDTDDKNSSSKHARSSDNTLDATSRTGSSSKSNFQESINSTVNSISAVRNEPHISDEEDDLHYNVTSHKLNLPAPSTQSAAVDDVLSGIIHPTLPSKQSQRPLTGPQLEDDIVSGPATSILGGLPQPKAEESTQFNFDDELEEEVKPKQYEKDLPKAPPKAKKRQPVKISAPILHDLDSDDEDEEQQKNKPSPANKTGSSIKLFSMLPAPKNIAAKEVNRPLIPHTLSKRPTPAGMANKPVKAAPKPLKPLAPRTVAKALVAEDSDDEDDGDGVNFFDIGKAEEVQPMEVPSIIQAGLSKTYKQTVMRAEHATGTSVDAEVEETEAIPGPAMMQPMSYSDSYEEPYGGEVQQFLHDDEFLKIQGKKHRGKEEINIIDVNVEEQVDRAEMMKTLTEEQQMSSHSRKRKDMPTSQQRRKHQITYLAFQAKERELELKNQWAANRQTKKQTQSKYGF